ncbi:hypothetical protein [Bacillus gobiensis]|uniref:hypothetical protein n=1 Tax=Bacillus gobiensis TaxID=1441095 RepID=UPI003D2549FE
MKYQTLPYLNILYLSFSDFKGWICNSINLNEEIGIENVELWLLDVLNFCKIPRSYGEIKENYSKEKEGEIEECLKTLTGLGLIINNKLDLHKNNWLVNNNISYVDYEQESVFNSDFKLMKKYIKNEDYPSIQKRFDGVHFQLLHPAYFKREGNLELAFETKVKKKKIPLTYESFSRFLFFSFGALREATFLNILPILLKLYPSNGARHEFELYLSIAGLSWFPNGLYHYNCMNHHITLIKKLPEKEPKHVKLFVSMVFERMQWRYRQGWAIRDIYLNFGHLSQHVKQTALSYGIDIFQLNLSNKEFISSFFPPLEEEIIGGFQLSL